MHKKGMKGETCAVQFLESRGYKILKRNFRSQRGEIDIIAQNDERIVFVEVKNWDSLTAHSLEYSINETKQKRILDTSRYFLYKNPHLLSNRIGYDIILIQHNQSVFNHIKNAFSGV